MSESSSERSDLELRITQLENRLEQLLGRQAPDVSPEDLATFKRVRQALGEGTCGINECQPCIIQLCRTLCSVCVVCRVCQLCIFECSCGPCGGFATGGGGLSRFEQMGGS
jgi:hypothetical protein